MTVTVTPRKGRPSATGKSHPAVGSRVGVPSGLKKGWSSREVTVLLTDLRGFSAIADSISGRDMLAVLPQPAAAIEVVAATLSGAAGSSESLSSFVFLTDERAGGEGGTG